MRSRLKKKWLEVTERNLETGRIDKEMVMNKICGIYVNIY